MKGTRAIVAQSCLPGCGPARRACACPNVRLKRQAQVQQLGNGRQAGRTTDARIPRAEAPQRAMLTNPGRHIQP